MNVRRADSAIVNRTASPDMQWHPDPALLSVWPTRDDSYCTSDGAFARICRDKCVIKATLASGA